MKIFFRLSVFCLLITVTCSFIIFKRKHSTANSQDPPFIKPIGNAWVDSVFRTLSADDRIAQLFMVAAYSNKDQQHVDQINNLVSNYNIGGLIFFQGGPMRQAMLTNMYQSKARTPLLISIDAEWGLAMRLDSTIRFPKQMTLGALKDNTLVYKMGAEIARQCKRLGVHVNFAPVVDVNNNPNNPVINNRSFGESKTNVSEKGVAYMKGMQDNGVLANAKHFPGHGDTDTDSHKALPIIKHSRAEMDTLELFPFRALIDSGLGSMMVAHLYIPSYDTTKNLASTLSKNIVTECLQDDLCFQGLIFTDALNMKGVSSFFEPGIVDVKALLAGNDVLLFSEDVPRAIKEIKRAILKKEISQEEIDRRVKKILSVKFWAGLNHYVPVDLENLYTDLNLPSANFLDYRLFESSLTLLKNKSNLVPFIRLDTLRLAAVALNDSAPNAFQKMLGMYAPIDLYQLPKDAPAVKLDTLLKKLSGYNAVFVSVHGTNTNPEKNFGITAQTIAAVSALQQKTKVILSVFGNPYCLSKIISAENSDVVLMGYEDLELPQGLAAQLLFGAIPASGRLPVTATGSFKLGDGISTSGGLRLKYTFPEEVNIRTKDLLRIDSLALRAIQQEATPGCQILVAKNGKVIYYKSFGFHTYPQNFVLRDKPLPVNNTDLYDIASVTKVAASSLAVMKLYEEGKIDLDKKLPRYLPELKNSNKNEIGIRDMLCHRAGLQSWIPFWMNTVKDGKLMKEYYRASPEQNFSTRVAQNLYIRNDYPDTIWEQIISSQVKDGAKYVYSDLGLMITKKIVERVQPLRFDSMVTKNFYSPLGLSTMGYQPRAHFPLDRIVPTENDIKFRKQLLQGDVHDPGAAMLGGISGHAGLFSDANDLAILMQMLLNKGDYGGTKYFNPGTVTEFTRQQFPESENRRGIIFDKPETDFTKVSPAARDASPKSFGHTGFTGTCIWADPESELIFIFLSNRVNPEATVNKLADLNVRTNIQQAVYDAMKKKQN